MRGPTIPYSPYILAPLIGFAAFTPVFSDEPEVVDPTSGEIVAVSEIDIDMLTAEQRACIGDQLVEQGIGSGCGGDRSAQD